MEQEKKFYHKIDYGLLLITLFLAGYSLIAIYISTNGTYGLKFVIRQIMFYAAGFIAIIASMFVDYRKLRTFSVPIYIIGIILLVLVIFIGIERLGAQRWLGLGSFTLQPSEFMKIFLVIIIAHLLTKFQDENEHTSLRGELLMIGKIALISILPFGLIVTQPDLGTSLVLIWIVMIMLLIAGVSWRILFTLILLGLLMIAGLVALYFINFDLFQVFIADHQLPRIIGWLNPEGDPSGYGYQLLVTLDSIGSGQLFGKALESSVQGAAQWSRIPEVHTDFIFAVIGEEFGFIGVSILIAAYFILIYRLIQIALTCNDRFGTYLIGGVIAIMVFHIFQNIGMTIGLMPITGLPLPFVSYGGSALLTNMISLGIVLNVAMRTKVYMFD